MNEKIQEVFAAVEAGKAKKVPTAVQEALDAGCDPTAILNEGMIAAMDSVGAKFKAGEIFVPEMLVAARAMKKGVDVLKPHLASGETNAAGKIIIGTVAGDLHDIGKNLVRMMMEGKGLEVIDLGTDVSPETFVKTAVEQNCQVICCSALLTTTMGVMEEVVKAAEAAGIRDKVKIMVGGAPVTDTFCQQIGADAYTADATSAAEKAVEFCA